MDLDTDTHINMYKVCEREHIQYMYTANRKKTVSIQTVNNKIFTVAVELHKETL
jgi:hypothetical protein